MDRLEKEFDRHLESRGPERKNAISRTPSPTSYLPRSPPMAQMSRSPRRRSPPHSGYSARSSPPRSSNSHARSPSSMSPRDRYRRSPSYSPRGRRSWRDEDDGYWGSGSNDRYSYSGRGGRRSRSPPYDRNRDIKESRPLKSNPYYDQDYSRQIPSQFSGYDNNKPSGSWQDSEPAPRRREGFDVRPDAPPFRDNGNWNREEPKRWGWPGHTGAPGPEVKNGAQLQWNGSGGVPMPAAAPRPVENSVYGNLERAATGSNWSWQGTGITPVGSNPGVSQAPMNAAGGGAVPVVNPYPRPFQQFQRPQFWPGLGQMQQQLGMGMVQQPNSNLQGFKTEQIVHMLHQLAPPPSQPQPQPIAPPPSQMPPPMLQPQSQLPHPDAHLVEERRTGPVNDNQNTAPSAPPPPAPVQPSVPESDDVIEGWQDDEGKKKKQKSTEGKARHSSEGGSDASQGVARMRNFVLNYIKHVLSPVYKSNKIDKLQFKNICKKASEKILRGELKVAPDGYNGSEEAFLTSSRKQRIKEVVQNYIAQA